ncbi:ribonuclease toxin immunity protein CdiI [Chitinimonas sp. JJ19]|uniref:ribonuclease toxin immunity protein CdiI n=1 Tax=Chitinimonas sp. JJ19 TaxID=3109352 RepID=UPI003003368F
MEDTVFPSVSHGKDYGWQALEFFNSLCSQDSFFWGVCLLVNKAGCVVNDDYCAFPDVTSDDLNDHFDGVLFGIGDSEVIVSEEFFSRAKRGVHKLSCIGS